MRWARLALEWRRSVSEGFANRAPITRVKRKPSSQQEIRQNFRKIVMPHVRGLECAHRTPSLRELRTIFYPRCVQTESYPQESATFCTFWQNNAMAIRTMDTRGPPRTKCTSVLKSRARDFGGIGDPEKPGAYQWVLPWCTLHVHTISADPARITVGRHLSAPCTSRHNPPKPGNWSQSIPSQSHDIPSYEI